MKLIIDRIENNHAVCFINNPADSVDFECLKSTKNSIDIPLLILPEIVEEGDLIILERKNNKIIIEVDKEYKQKRIDFLKKKYGHLWA